MRYPARVKPPPNLPSVLVASGEAAARRLGIDPGDFWAYVYRKKAPPPEVRAALVEAFFPLVKPTDFLLTAHDRHSTLPTMPTGEIEQAQRGRPSPIRNHPLMKALRKAGVTVVEEAKRTKRSDASIRAYCFPPNSSTYRPVPRQLAKDWSERYDVPLSVWHGFTG